MSRAALGTYRAATRRDSQNVGQRGRLQSSRGAGDFNEVAIRSGNRHLETLGQDSMMALIDDSPRSATVVTLTDITVAPIKERHFLCLVRHTPFFALRVMPFSPCGSGLRTEPSDRRGPPRGSSCRMGRGVGAGPANEKGPRIGGRRFDVSPHEAGAEAAPSARGRL